MKAANHFNPEPHARKKVSLGWIFDKSPIHLNPRFFTGCTVHHLIPAVQSHKQGLMVIYSYWWVLNSSAFTEMGRKAMQWWTKTGAGEGGDAEHFWTNFPRMPDSTGWPAKGKGVGLHYRGCVLRSGLTIRLFWGPCTCVCPQLPRSPYTPQRSTIWTCTHIWWFVWLGWYRTPAHSTWPRSRLYHVMTYCRHAQLCQGTLQRKSKRVRYNGQKFNWN